MRMLSDRLRAASNVPGAAHGRRDPALDGSDRPAEGRCGLFVGPSFEVAEDHRSAEAFWETLDFFVQDRAEVVEIVMAAFGIRDGSQSFMTSLTSRGGACAECGLVGNAMEPRSERLFHPEPACFFHKDKERGLKRILRIVLIDENVPADSQDHRPVPLDERGERQFRGLAAIGHESFEKLAVRQIMNCADVEECSQLTTRCSELASRHDSVSASLLNAPVRHNLTSAADGSENPKRIEKFVVPGARRDERSVENTSPKWKRGI